MEMVIETGVGIRIGVGQGGTLIEMEIQIRGFYLHLRLYLAPLPLD